MNIDLNNVSKETWIRTIALLLAIVNKLLVIKGISPIPIDSEQVVSAISDLLLIITALIAWWKDNSFTVIAQNHNRRMLQAKKEWRRKKKALFK